MLSDSPALAATLRREVIAGLTRYHHEHGDEVDSVKCTVAVVWDVLTALGRMTPAERFQEALAAYRVAYHQCHDSPAASQEAGLSAAASILTAGLVAENERLRCLVTSLESHEAQLAQEYFTEVAALASRLADATRQLQAVDEVCMERERQLAAATAQREAATAFPADIHELARDYGHPYMTEEEQMQFAALIDSIRAWQPAAAAEPGDSVPMAHVVVLTKEQIAAAEARRDG